MENVVLRVSILRLLFGRILHLLDAATQSAAQKLVVDLQLRILCGLGLAIPFANSALDGC